MSTPKYPDIKVKLNGEDGNAFVVMGKTQAALRKNKVPKSEIEEYLKEAMAGDYNNLLVTTMKWVNVI